MVLDLNYLVKKYSMNIKNIIHVGGHFGQEVSLYKTINPDNFIQIFEPHPVTFTTLINNVSNFANIECHNVALGPNKSVMTMYCETNNEGQSNSLLEPQLHASQYPNIRFHSTVEVPVETLDSFKLYDSYNFMSLDVQGFELEVLKGAVNTLIHVDYIIAEVNNAPLYKNCCMIEELDQFLSTYGFNRVEIDWIGGTWGDAFYIKNKVES